MNETLQPLSLGTRLGYIKKIKKYRKCGHSEE